MLLDVSKKWVILSPAPATKSIRRLAGVFARLRKKASLPADKPEILDAHTECAPPDAAEIIINWSPDSKKKGFAWRAGEDRIEFYGHCSESLDEAIADFTQALGITRGCKPEGEGALYPLSKKAEFRFN